MTYQDKWCNGKLVANGYRECEPRYELVRDFCYQFDRPFTVLDIGANMCYFGLRLTEDFPLCSVMAFEFHQFAMRKAHVDSCKQSRLMFLERKLSLGDLTVLSACCHFDVVLALSVVHHLPGSFDEWIKALRCLGANVLIEFALDDSKRVSRRNGYHIPDDAAQLGKGVSHLSASISRPIVRIPGETRLERL